MNIDKYFTEEEFDRFTALVCKMIENGQQKESDMLIKIVKETTIEEFEALVILVKVADSKKQYIYNLTPNTLKMPSNTNEAMKAFRQLLDSLNGKGYFCEYKFATGVKVVHKIVIDLIVYNAMCSYIEEFNR